MTDQPETLPEAEAPPARVYTGQEILFAASYATGFTIAEITGPLQIRQIARVRHAIMRMTRVLVPELSFQKVARVVGRTDHTTVLHAMNLQGKAALAAVEIEACIQAILDVGPVEHERPIRIAAPPQMGPTEPTRNPRIAPWIASRLAQGMSPYHAERLAKWQGYEWVSP